MMKWSVIIIFILISAKIYARDDRQLLKCLGEEEKKFHLNKVTGPLYDLNQRLISEMIQIPKAEIRSEDFNRICRNSKISPGLKLLELSIRQGKEMFIIPESTERMQKQMTLGMIDDYLEATKEILLNFISQIQTLSPTPTCLKEEIPQLDKFFIDIKYLQEDIDIKRIFAGRDSRILEKLKDYPEAFERCSARLKKKPKSGSTEPAKKP